MPQKIESKAKRKQSNPTPSAAPRKSGRYHEDDTSRMAVTIAALPDAVYSYFRDFANLPNFMKDLKEVTVTSAKTSHWVVELKNGLGVEWDAEIVKERPGQMISWQSVEGSEIETSGSIWFSPAPEGKGTVVGLVLEYKIPGGGVTELLTKLTGEDPESLAYINLKRLKALLETGEIPTIEGQPSGRDADAEMIVTH